MCHGLLSLAIGIASYFYALRNYGVGDVFCAMNGVKAGSQVLVVRDNRLSTHCIVVGTGPFHRGRVIDLSPQLADRLRFRYAGLARVRVYLEGRGHARSSCTAKRRRLWQHNPL